MKTFSLLVKPASADCNLRCDYCFYLGRASLYPEAAVHRMSDEVLDRVITTYMATDQPQHDFCWQGGEPALLGVEFFRRVTDLQTLRGRPGSVVANCLQTNGTLIDGEFAAHLADYRFLVGVSIDGPPEFHDHHRRDRRGGGSHGAVMKGVAALRSRGVEPDALAVITRSSAGRAREVYGHLRELGFDHHQYIPCVEWDGDGELLPFALDGEAWGGFLRELFDAWWEEGAGRASVRWFDALIERLSGGPGSFCSMGRDCRRYFVVEHGGDVYPCDFFVDEDLRLGNVRDDPWTDLARSDRYRAFGERKRGWAEECGRCSWLSLCAGDCLKHRPGGGRETGARSLLCAGWKSFFEYALPRLESLASPPPPPAEEVFARAPAPERRPGAGRNDPCPCGSGRKRKRCCGA